MEKVKVFNIEAAGKISAITPSDSQLLILNNVLMNALQKRVIVECPREPNSTIILKANFIRSSDFLDSYGKLKRCGWEKVSSLEIYALDTLFIDQDLNAFGERLKLSIVASKWEVIGNRKILLDGRDGGFSYTAPGGFWPGNDGHNGSPGLAGGSAGAFFGVAGLVVSGENLVISANGGKGGPGQSGGDGANGQNGITSAERKTCNLEAYRNAGFEISVNDNCYIYPCKGDRGRVYGKYATKGGNAGSCGVGGQGGLKGEIFFTSVTKNSLPVKAATNGEKGRNGVSGQVGYGGQHGNDRIVVCKEVGVYKDVGFYGGAAAGATIGAAGGPPGMAVGAALGALSGFLAANWKESEIPSLEFTNSYLISKGSAEDGQASDSCNSNIPENPLPARDFQNVGSYFENFQRFLVENYNERFVGLVAREYNAFLSKNPEIRNLLD